MPHNDPPAGQTFGEVHVLYPKDKVDEEVRRLAKLSDIEYERCRAEKAKELGLRAKVLDRLVQDERTTTTDATLATPEPWDQEVDGAALLEELAETFTKFLVLEEHAATALALWVLHTHCITSAVITPRLGVVSPVKRCGKSTLLGVLYRLTPRPLKASNITTAVLFRSIDKWQPTLLVDEADTFLKTNDELRGVLNAGHAAGECVIRAEGESFEPRVFDVFGAVAIALIGKLPDTLEDRSIRISMKRKKAGETVESFRADRDHGLHRLARMCAKWAEGAGDLRDRDPDVPPELHDRAADNWRHLLAIADAAGGAWPKLARQAAVALSGGEDEEVQKTMLLRDICEIFDEIDIDRIRTDDLVAKLVAMEERPWAEINRGKPLNPRRLADMLRPFSITSSTVRLHTGIAKGYYREAFEDARGRYLGTAKALHRYSPQKTAENGLFQNVTSPPVVTAENSLKPAENQACNVVTAENPPEAGARPSEAVDHDVAERAAIQEIDGKLADEDPSGIPAF